MSEDRPGPFDPDRDRHGDNRLSMLARHLNPNVVRGRTLHLEQSVPRQIRRGAHGLDLGRAEAVEIVANFVAVEI